MVSSPAEQIEEAFVGIAEVCLASKWYLLEPAWEVIIISSFFDLPLHVPQSLTAWRALPPLANSKRSWCGGLAWCFGKVKVSSRQDDTGGQKDGIWFESLVSWQRTTQIRLLVWSNPELAACWTVRLRWALRTCCSLLHEARVFCRLWLTSLNDPIRPWVLC